VYKRIISVVKRVEFLSDRMSYIIPRGRWCGIIVLNFHAPRDDETSIYSFNFVAGKSQWWPGQCSQQPLSDWLRGGSRFVRMLWLLKLLKWNNWRRKCHEFYIIFVNLLYNSSVKKKLYDITDATNLLYFFKLYNFC
jgi:hypothetical protein